MPLSNKRSWPRNISPNRQTRRKPFPDRNTAANYHEIALRAAETGQKPQEDVIHSWLQDVRDRLEISSRINRASPVGEVDHEASWKPVFASPKTQALLKSSNTLPPPQILSRDVLLHSSPPELAKRANAAETTNLISLDQKRRSSTENNEHDSGKVADRPFEKRRRHKTRHDRYDTKKRRHPTGHQTAPEKKKRRETAQEPCPRSGQEILRNFASSHIGQGRIALKPKLGFGLFANGKGSDVQPMFNLKFAETAFPIEHTDTPAQSDSKDRTKHKRRRSKELQDATGFFEQSIDLIKPCFDSRTSHPATPFHEQSSLFVPSSTLRQPTKEVIIKSIEDVHPSQRIITETPNSKLYSQKQLSDVAKSRSLVGASSRGSIPRLNSKHMSSASNLSLALTPCRAPKMNSLNTSTKSRQIQTDSAANQAERATSRHDRKTQTGPGITKRPNSRCQNISILPEANSDELHKFGNANIGPVTQFDAAVIEIGRPASLVQIIDQQSSPKDSSRLQKVNNGLNDNNTNFLSPFRPPNMRRIWDADSIDAAIRNNLQDFEPTCITYNEHEKIDLVPQKQGSHRRSEAGITHVRQFPLLANESTFAAWRGPNTPFEQGTGRQAKTAAPAFEQAMSNDCPAESHPRVSSAAMRAFWEPNYLV